MGVLYLLEERWAGQVDRKVELPQRECPRDLGRPFQAECTTVAVMTGVTEISVGGPLYLMRSTATATRRATRPSVLTITLPILMGIAAA